MSDFVLHCGHCGQAMGQLHICISVEGVDTMMQELQMFADAIDACAGHTSAMHVPPMLPPSVPPTTLPPRVKFGAYMICSRCKLASEWCACAKTPPPPPTQGDGESSDLNARIRALKGAP